MWRWRANDTWLLSPRSASRSPSGEPFSPGWVEKHTGEHEGAAPLTLHSCRGQNVALNLLCVVFFYIPIMQETTLCWCAVGGASQRAISRGTDGSAAAAAPWLRTRTGLRSACLPPRLRHGPAESPPIPPGRPSCRTAGSGSLATRTHHTDTHTHAKTAKRVFINAITKDVVCHV